MYSAGGEEKGAQSRKGGQSRKCSWDILKVEELPSYITIFVFFVWESTFMSTKLVPFRKVFFVYPFRSEKKINRVAWPKMGGLRWPASRLLQVAVTLNELMVPAFLPRR